jgi:hypothetical protein
MLNLSMLSIVAGTAIGVLVYLGGRESALDSSLWGFVGSMVALISLSTLRVQGGIRYRDRNHYVMGVDGGSDEGDGDD